MLCWSQKNKAALKKTACRFAHVSGIASEARATCAGLRAFIVSPSTLTICCKDSDFSITNVLDLTNSPLVAAFFATTEYDGVEEARGTEGIWD